MTTTLMPNQAEVMDMGNIIFGLLRRTFNSKEWSIKKIKEKIQHKNYDKFTSL